MRPQNSFVAFLATIVLLSVTPELAAGTGSSLSHWFMLPAVTHAPGKKGTFWQTDVAIVNPSPTRKIHVSLWFLPKDRDNSVYAHHRQITVDPGSQVTLPDIVVGTFDLSGGTGSMVLKAANGACFSVSSRTHTGATRTYGMMEDGQKHSTSGNLSAFIGGIKNDSRFRTNVGVAAATVRPIDVLVEAYDNEGLFKGEEILRVKPWGMIQIAVDSFTTSFSDGYLILTGLSSPDDAKWVGYATTIDNISGDATFSAARTDEQYTWADPRFNQSGWWEGSMSSAHGSFYGYLLIDQVQGRLVASMYDSNGMIRSGLSGYEHHGKIFVTDITVYDAMCMETEFISGRITSESDAVYGNVTVSSDNPTECVDGTMTMYFSPLEDPPFTSAPEKAGRALVTPSIPALRLEHETPTSSQRIDSN